MPNFTTIPQVPQEAYDHLFSLREPIKNLPSDITKYMALCLPDLGWRICNLKSGDVYTRESYKKAIGHYPPLPHDGEMIAPYPTYAEALYKEFLLVRKSYKRFLKTKRPKSKGFATAIKSPQ
jgi:hypothetical protein